MDQAWGWSGISTSVTQVRDYGVLERKSRLVSLCLYIYVLNYMNKGEEFPWSETIFCFSKLCVGGVSTVPLGRSN